MRLSVTKVVTPDLVISEVTDIKHGQCIKISVAEAMSDGIECIEKLLSVNKNKRQYMKPLEEFESVIDGRKYKSYLVDTDIVPGSIHQVICSEFLQSKKPPEDILTEFFCEWVNEENRNEIHK